MGAGGPAQGAGDTLEEFDFAASSNLPDAQIRGLGAPRWLHAGESVILFGPVGAPMPEHTLPERTVRAAHTAVGQLAAEPNEYTPTKARNRRAHDDRS